jgi:hypothetical protein
MKHIIQPVPREDLEKELTEDKFVRLTNFEKNEIYIVTHHDSPNVMREIGRVRELSFRYAGGGTGKELDIDHFDTAEVPYSQLIVWEPIRKEILGGYRFMVFKYLNPDKNGEYDTATLQLFKFSDKFYKEYFPYTIELGRSFVQPNYQSNSPLRKGIYALDNLWDGLGSLVNNYPEIKYFFGKVTMYFDFNKRARDMILFFLHKHFKDIDKLVYPIHPLEINTDREELEKIFSGKDYLEDYKSLSRNVRALGENIPPLINSYMNLSPTMKTFGTSNNPHFGNVEETGILISINDIYDAKKDRHIKQIKTK